MKLNLNTLEIKILLRCETNPISRSDLTQFFRSYSKEERARAIENLTTNEFIITQEMPKIGSNKTPIFYKITGTGKKWVEDYNKNYPS